MRALLVVTKQPHARTHSRTYARAPICCLCNIS